MHVLLGFIITLNLLIPAFANAKECHDLFKLQSNSKSKRAYAWPEVPPEMIASIKELSTNEHNEISRDRDFFSSLKAALENQHPDQVVHELLGFLTPEEIFVNYNLGIDKSKVIIEVPAVATFTIRKHADELAIDLRRTIAVAISKIRSDDLKLKWIQFLMNDPIQTVANDAVYSYSSLSDQKRRDQFAIDHEEKWTHPILRGLTTASPAVRWKIVRRVIENKAIEIAPIHIIKLLKSVASSDLSFQKLESWYQDYNLKNSTLEHLSNYSSNWKKQKLAGQGEITKHDDEAHRIARNVLKISNQDLQKSILQKIAEVASIRSEAQEFAQDIFIYIRLEKFRSRFQGAIAEKLEDQDVDLAFWRTQAPTGLNSYGQKQFVDVHILNPGMLGSNRRMAKVNKERAASQIAWTSQDIDNISKGLVP